MSLHAYNFRYLPREVDPLVYNMSHEDPGNISYSEVGGLSEQIRELREVCIFSMSTCSYLTSIGQPSKAFIFPAPQADSVLKKLLHELGPSKCQSQINIIIL